MAAIAAIIAAGALIRLLGCFDQFWLDEIWSYFSARGLSSPAQVFTGIHHSNNHHLYTLLLFLAGDQRQWSLYRIPSLLAGVGTLVLLTHLAWRRGRLEAIFTALLAASCYALVYFSSEARGYALVVFFASSAYWALDRFLTRQDSRSAWIFGVCAILGILSHLIFLFFYAGAMAWSAWRLLATRASRSRGAVGMLRLHLLPLLAFAALYQIDLRRMEVGGGDPAVFEQVLAESVAYTLGLPVVRQLALPYAALAALILGLGLWLFRKERTGAWLLFLVTILIAPAAVMVVARPVVVAVRYFVIGIVFFLLLGGILLAHLYRTGSLGRVTSVVVLALFLLGNSWHTAGFLRLGRGGYLDALLYMARHTESQWIVAGFDHDFRNGIVVRFYARYLPPEKELTYYPQGQWPAEGPEWVITHKASRPRPPVAEIADPVGNRYALAAEFDYAAISGFYWAVYRNERQNPRRGSVTP